MKTTPNLGPTQTFAEAVLDALAGKENELVQFASGTRTIELCTSGEPIGVYEGKLQEGDINCTVRMLTAEGTIRVKQAGAIAIGARVKRSSSKVATAATPAAGQVLIGVKVAPASNGSADDIIEVLPLRGLFTPVVPVASTAATTSAATINALAVGASYTQAEIQALRTETAKIATDLAAIRANLVTGGAFSA